MARWGSSIILKYLGDAPHRAITETYIRNRQALADRAARAIQNHDRENRQADNTVDCLDETPADEQEATCFVQHRQTKRVHIISSDDTFSGLRDLKTICHWDASLPNVHISDTFPINGELCKDCRKAADKLGLTVNIFTQ